MGMSQGVCIHTCPAYFTDQVWTQDRKRKEYYNICMWELNLVLCQLLANSIALLIFAIYGLALCPPSVIMEVVLPLCTLVHFMWVGTSPSTWLPSEKDTTIWRHTPPSLLLWYPQHITTEVSVMHVYAARTVFICSMSGRKDAFVITPPAKSHAHIASQVTHWCDFNSWYQGRTWKRQ